MKALFERISLSLLQVSFSLFPAATQASWEVDSEWSKVYFMSYKNSDVAESHLFNSVRGQVQDSGEAVIEIDLRSVDTQIPIRDQRMQELLFETQKYPTATIKAQIDSSWLKQVLQGVPKTTQLQAQLFLHGQEKTIKLSVMATKTQQGQVQVVSLKPIIINADFWDLGTGIGKLKDVAGLNAISLSIPVGFTLNFDEK